MSAPESSTLFETPEAFALWLETHQHDETGLWLRLGKKNGRLRAISYDEALLVALAYGWIDGQRRSLDADSFVQRYTPRRAKSPWSRRNCGLVEGLIESGRMKPRGLLEVERAKADGRWERAYEGQASARVPEDFLAALSANEKALAFYETLDAQSRFALYFRLQSAPSPAARARRLASLVETLASEKRP